MNTPPVDMLPPDTFPDTVNVVSVPTDVTLGCEAVVRVPVTKVPDTLPVDTLPDTVSDVSVPVDVILGCAAVVTVPAVVALPLKLPVNVTEVMFTNPVSVFAVDPKLTVVFPRATLLFASLALIRLPDVNAVVTSLLARVIAPVRVLND